MNTSLDTNPHTHDDSAFDGFADAIRRRFVTLGDQPLFTCDAPNLYDIYLGSFHTAEERQHHTCHCCRQFIERFGNLVVIDPDTGKHKSAIWPDHDVGFPTLYKGAAADLSHEVRRAKIDGVFVAKEKTWGTPEAGGFTHFSLKPDPAILHKDRLLEPHQVMAQKKQDFGTLSHGLADFNVDTVKAALSLLSTDSLYRSEKVLGPAQFLFDLHTTIANVAGLNRNLRNNLIWLAVATAPKGFATPRSSMVGTLLEDIAAGKSSEQVARSFAAKMHPLQYQRPQAAPSAGNIAQAEKIVEKLGITESLKRRFARLDEMKLLWSPPIKSEPVKAAGMFDHLKGAKDSTREVVGQGGAITWTKFARTVLPNAEKILVRMEDKGNFVGVLTAVNPEAPPILQWDNEGQRNPVSWYVYSGGSTPAQWGLSWGSWVEATGVMLKPCHWFDESRFTQFAQGAIFILKGAEDRRKHGLSIFPETLRSELHSIRSTIEAFSNAGSLDETDQATANGIFVGEGKATFVKVTTTLGTTEYRIDRWD